VGATMKDKNNCQLQYAYHVLKVKNIPT
jgi:hypothetical protein